MTNLGSAHSLQGGRHVVVVVNDHEKWTSNSRARREPADETVSVPLNELLEALVFRFESSVFSRDEFATVLEEIIDDESTTVNTRGAMYALGQLVDPDQLGTAQLGTTPEWEYRLATHVRQEYEAAMSEWG